MLIFAPALANCSYYDCGIHKVFRCDEAVSHEQSAERGVRDHPRSELRKVGYVNLELIFGSRFCLKAHMRVAVDSPNKNF